MFNQQPYGGQSYGTPTQSTPQATPAVNLPGLDDLLSGSGKSFFNADSQPGASITGTVKNVEVTAYRDFQTQQPAYWKDGKPMTQIHIVLDTNLQEGSDDDGSRSLWIKGWGVQLRALTHACQVAGVKTPVAGDTMTATFTGLGERGQAPQAPKLYEYVIQHETTAAQVINAQPQQAPQAAPQQAQPVAQQQYQPAPTTPVQTAPQLDVNQVRQLESMGKSPAEIAGFLGVPAETIQQVMQEQPPF